MEKLFGQIETETTQEGDKVELNTIPVTANLNIWKVGLEDAVAATASRHDDLAIKWVKAASHMEIEEEELVTVPPKFCSQTTK